MKNKRGNKNQSKLTLLPGDLLELEVPGLSEKRPSLIVGDLVNLRLHGELTAYKGLVASMNGEMLTIEAVSEEFICMIRAAPATEVDVAFQLSRIHLERSHNGVNTVVNNNMQQFLFPDISLERNPIKDFYKLQDAEFFNQHVVNNVEQRRAIDNILNGTSKNAPYIVFGPPGTGKSITIIEAILQIKKRRSGAKILVCAVSNAACDMLASKLLEHCETTELIRVHSSTREWGDVSAEVRKFSNYANDNYISPIPTDLMKYKIVIATLTLIGRYHRRYGYRPEYVFIDEAAQATEPEADIAIAFLKNSGQVVLTGDPKQLGPQCSSRVAERHGLCISLLDRLMTTNLLYKNFNSNFVTMLRRNFRSHPLILHLPNKFFYNDQLIAMSQHVANDPIATICIYSKVAGMKKNVYEGSALEFCGIIGKDMTEGQSPSYFNQAEIEAVKKYVKALLNLNETRVTCEDIGIIAPYKRQVYRIKEQLAKMKLSKIEVGTTEVFQGREKRIIIISTVRSKPSLLKQDKQYQLGFVKNKKRFNVAVTRPKGKLIVIGCPHVLSYDEKWMAFMELCQQQNAYFGAKLIQRTADVKHNILKRLDRLQIKQT